MLRKHSLDSLGGVYDIQNVLDGTLGSYGFAKSTILLQLLHCHVACVRKWQHKQYRRGPLLPLPRRGGGWGMTCQRIRKLRHRQRNGLWHSTNFQRRPPSTRILDMGINMPHFALVQSALANLHKTSLEEIPWHWEPSTSE